MRRRSTALSALAATLLLTAVAATPAFADDAPAPPPVTSAAAAPAAAAPAPDLSVFALNPNDPNVQRGSDFTIRFGVSGTAADATLTLTFPADVVVRAASADPDGRPVTCTGTGTATCALGAITQYTNVDIVFGLRADAPIGTDVPVTGTISSAAGPDSDPSNDTAVTGVTVAGHSVLTHTASPDPLLLPAGGGTGRVTFTVTNTGPDPASGVVVQFAIQSNDTPAPTFAGFSKPVVTPLPRTPQWRIGDLAAGASVSIVADVASAGVVRDSELSYSTSFAGGTVCDNPACLDGVALRTAAAPPASTPPVVTPPSTGPVLANTGSDDGVLALVAVGLLAGGGALVALGRRRRT